MTSPPAGRPPRGGPYTPEGRAVAARLLAASLVAAAVLHGALLIGAPARLFDYVPAAQAALSLPVAGLGFAARWRAPRAAAALAFSIVALAWTLAFVLGWAPGA